AGFQQELSAGIPGDRSAGGAAAQAIPLPGDSLPDATAHHRPLVDHGLAVDLLHRARAAWSIRECAQIRPAGAASRQGFYQAGEIVREEIHGPPFKDRKSTRL